MAVNPVSVSIGVVNNASVPLAAIAQQSQTTQQALQGIVQIAQGVSQGLGGLAQSASTFLKAIATQVQQVSLAFSPLQQSVQGVIQLAQATSKSYEQAEKLAFSLGLEASQAAKALGVIRELTQVKAADYGRCCPAGSDSRRASGWSQNH
ncbi:MAG: hypothetical protein NVS2B14_17790 [Chamaesiphon sp.]